MSVGTLNFFGQLPRLLYLFKVQQPQGRDGHRLTAQMNEETKRICGQERTKKNVETTHEFRL